MKNIACVSLLLIIFAFLNVDLALCEEDIAALKNRLEETKNEIAKLEEGYKLAKAKVKKTCDVRIVEIKKEFHAKRSKYLEERNKALKDMKRQYENKIGPMKLREKQLTNLIRPKESANFAKNR